MVKVVDRLTVSAIVLLAALVLAAVTWWWWAGSSSPVPWGDPVVRGDVVRVSYVGSACSTGAAADVEERSDEVVLTVHEQERRGACSDVGVPSTIEVVLDAPLGERALVDGACLLAEWRSRPACSGG